MKHPRLRARRFQFRLRFLFGLISVFAVFSGWLTYRSRVERQQAAIIQRLESEGARAGFGEKPLSLFGIPLRDTRLEIASYGRNANLADAATLRNLVSLNLIAVNLKEGELRHLAKLSKLEHLSLCDVKLTDRDLSHIGGLTTLQSLCLGNTGVSDEALSQLANLQQLEILDVSGLRIGDRGMRNIAMLRNLREVWFVRCDPAVGPGLKHLRGLTKLTSLDLRACQLSGPGFEWLRESHSLTVLRLAGNPLDDNAILHLGQISGLEHLDLSNTPLTDDELEYLTPATKLRLLDIRQTNVTARGVSILRQKMPDVEVLANPPRQP